MAQPVSSGQYTRVSGTAAGTTLISDSPATLVSVTGGANYTGTIIFYDTGTVTGSTAANYLIAINNNTGSIPFTIAPGINTKKGIIAVVGGTTDILVGWDK